VAADTRSSTAGGSGGAHQQKHFQVHQQPEVYRTMGSIVKELAAQRQAGDRQPHSTDDNRTQPVQRDCVGPGQMREPAFIDWRMVSQCEDELAAINLCIDLSKQKDESLAKDLGIDKGHFSRIRKGMANFPDRKRLALQRLCGNWVPLQYEILNGPPLRRLLDELDGGGSPFHPAASRGLPRELRA
jgi:hypothetical protein